MLRANPEIKFFHWPNKNRTEVVITMRPSLKVIPMKQPEVKKNVREKNH